MKNPFFWFLFLYFIIVTTLIITINAGRISGVHFNLKLPSNVNGSSNFGRLDGSMTNKCRNNESSAEDCFDYFKLALFWPKAYAFEVQNRGLNIKQDRLLDKWIIHGLWAQKYSGKVSRNCKRNNIEFHSEILKRNNKLSDKLHSMWFSILNTHSFNDESFWKHEWNAHGSCSSRIPALNNVEKYFGKSLEIYEKLDVNSKLVNNENYKPGYTDTLENIVDYYDSQIGKKIDFNFIGNIKTNEWYLKEIYICYNLSLKLIDCPGGRHMSDDIKQKKIKYLNNVPT